MLRNVVRQWYYYLVGACHRRTPEQHESGLSYRIVEEILYYMELSDVTIYGLSFLVRKSEVELMMIFNGTKAVTVDDISEICDALNLKVSVSVEQRVNK